MSMILKSNKPNFSNPYNYYMRIRHVRLSRMKNICEDFCRTFQSIENSFKTQHIRRRHLEKVQLKTLNV